jgi:prevent-host-death family protein
VVIRFFNRAGYNLGNPDRRCAVERQWSISEAKIKFSEVIDKAISRVPQVLTRRGKEVAVILSWDEYKRLRKAEVSLVDFFRSSPLVGVDLDPERDKSLPRDAEL